MKKLILLAVVGVCGFALSAQAQFFGISIGGRCGGISVGIGAPVCYAPAPVAYAPPVATYAPPVTYAPPAYYAPAPVVYPAPVPYYGYGYGPSVVIGGGYRGCWGGYYGRGYYGYRGYRGGGWHH